MIVTKVIGEIGCILPVSNVHSKRIPSMANELTGITNSERVANRIPLTKEFN